VLLPIVHIKVAEIQIKAIEILPSKIQNKTPSVDTNTNDPRIIPVNNAQCRRKSKDLTCPLKYSSIGNRITGTISTNTKLITGG
jgi:hypothetical protein